MQRAIYSRRVRGKQGYILVATALSIPFLLGVSGLSIDIGRMYITKSEVQAFADINVAWLARMLAAASVPASKRETRARAIFAAVAGAQLMARGRADLKLFDALIDSFRGSGLIPT